MMPETFARPEAVIFDIGNVLVAWQPEARLDAMIGQARREALFAHTGILAMNEALDMGGDFRSTVYALAEATPAYADDIRLWHDRWLEIIGPEIPRSVEILRALRRRGVPVFALSNFGVATFALAERTWPFLAEFDRRFISGQIGMMKPDPRFFAALEAASGIVPGALLFADDREDNIAVAAARGWQTHLFATPEGWAERLISAGLLAPGELAWA